MVSRNEKSDHDLDVSVVMPCLNESSTVEGCVKEAIRAFEQHGLRGEVVVSDNGSSDGSAALAEGAGARVITVLARGYGAALRGGFDAARAPLIVMGDADASYNFEHVGRVVAALRGGADVAVGDRFAEGIEKGAMPWSHRLIGNPGLSLLAWLEFGRGVRDVYCGLRGFRVDRLDHRQIRSTGMPFAVEMVGKAHLAGLTLVSVPTELRRDGRSGRSHLRTLRDGWRTLVVIFGCSERQRAVRIIRLLLSLVVVMTFVLSLGDVTLGRIRLSSGTLVFLLFLAVFLSIIDLLLACLGAAGRRLVGHPEMTRASGVGLRRLGARILVGLGVTGLSFSLLRWADSGFGDLGRRDSVALVGYPAMLAVVGVIMVLREGLARLASLNDV